MLTSLLCIEISDSSFPSWSWAFLLSECVTSILSESLGNSISWFLRGVLLVLEVVSTLKIVPNIQFKKTKFYSKTFQMPLLLLIPIGLNGLLITRGEIHNKSKIY